MDVCQQIVDARQTGTVRCRILAQPLASVDETAAAFDLAPIAFLEVDEAAARRIVQDVLGRDLAHDGSTMDSATAEDLTVRFFSYFASSSCRYFTNRCLDGRTWVPATAATFDAGVIILAPHQVGCIWVEDED